MPIPSRSRAAKKNKLDKLALVTYIRNDCERYLFWQLGRNDPAWMIGAEKLRHISRTVIRPKYLLDLGKKFEQLVYQKLLALASVRCHQDDPVSDVHQWNVHPADFDEIYDEVARAGTRVLLEHQIDTPETFMNFVFPEKPGGIHPALEIGDVRPDIMIVERLTKQDGVHELLPGGETCLVPEAELLTRWSITIIDIKNTFKDKIGKKQFIEIFYYAYFLSFYLHEHNLDDKFFVNTSANGILPRLDTSDISKITSFQEFVKATVSIRWSEAQRIFMKAIDQIRALWQKVPCNVDDVPARMSSECAFCFYVEDCKCRFGYDVGARIEDCAVDLLPFTTQSIIEQLKDLGMKTIGDVYRGVKVANTGLNPDPLLPEKQILYLKARSLVEGSIAMPAPGEVSSYLIPRYTPTTIIFDCEADPSNDHVYVVGLYLDIGIAKGVPYTERYDWWWNTWIDALHDGADNDAIKAMLDEGVIVPVPIEQVRSFREALADLSIYKLDPPRRDDLGQLRSHARFNYLQGYLSTEMDPDNELGLLKKFIDILHAILEIALILELNVVAEGFTAGQFLGPEVGIFYWSEGQLDNFQAMIERHIDRIVADPPVWEKYAQIIDWFSPSETEVTHPLQHKKIYDLKEFARYTIGLPCIVNYTWHDIARKVIKDFRISPSYWIRHYDHLNFLYWHKFLLETDAAKKMEDHLLLVKQVLHKLRTLDKLRFEFQKNAREAISPRAKPVSGLEYRSIIPGPGIHDIGHVWYMHSRLDGAVGEMEADFLRTTFPDYAIGKLEAAEISVPRKRNDGDGAFHFEFDITGQSTNVKNVAENEKVFVIPDTMRDKIGGKLKYKWLLRIDDMAWLPAIKGYRLVTESTKNDLLQQFSESLR